jgi:hypothetical protein
MTLTRVVYATGGLLALTLAGAFTAPKLAAAIKAAYVEVVIPSRPFAGSMQATNTKVSVGPDTGTLGVSNLTLTNFDSAAQQVFIFQPTFAFGGCGGSGAAINGGSTPQMQVYVQPFSTLVIPYPTPLVFPGFGGHTCVAAEVTTVLHGGSVQIDVTGFVN